MVKDQDLEKLYLQHWILFKFRFINIYWWVFVALCYTRPSMQWTNKTNAHFSQRTSDNENHCQMTLRRTSRGWELWPGVGGRSSAPQTQRVTWCFHLNCTSPACPSQTPRRSGPPFSIAAWCRWSSQHALWRCGWSHHGALRQTNAEGESDKETERKGGGREKVNEHTR